jgi:hypothetical protein
MRQAADVKKDDDRGNEEIFQSDGAVNVTDGDLFCISTHISR